MEEEAVMEKEIIQTKPMFSLLPPPPAEEEIYEESQEIIASFLPISHGIADSYPKRYKKLFSKPILSLKMYFH